jgi:hypothetical protein
MKEVKSLKVSWASKMASDLRHFHGLNAQEELNGIIRVEMRKRSIIKIWKSKN